jgi:hypothetical protein
MKRLEADYLVVGAGASGMAFVDSLIDHVDAKVVMVDRRATPGGHWNDAYPFVRLHQPSAIYGVNSTPLGQDRIEEDGLNAGFYEQAGAAEICDYYLRVLTDRLVPSGKVKYFGRHEFGGRDDSGYRLASHVTGDVTLVTAHKLVDATYLEASLPTTHKRNYEVDPQARITTPAKLPTFVHSADRFTILGGGKTAMDTCSWLLEERVDPAAIRWVRPRDSWVYDRAATQPLDLVSSTIRMRAAEVEAAAEAQDLDDLYVRAERAGAICRFDPEVDPELFHGATLSQAELALLRTITDVVRLGRIRRVDADELQFDDGVLPTRDGELYVDCTASGIPLTTGRKVFQEELVTPQCLRVGNLCFSAALIGFLEATGLPDDDKNRLARPNPLPRTRSRLDWAWSTHISGQNAAAWRSRPEATEWVRRSRLNVAAAVAQQRDTPEVKAARATIATHAEAAMVNLSRMLGDEDSLATLS